MAQPTPETHSPHPMAPPFAAPIHDSELEVRPVRDADSPGLVALIGGCFQAYENCILDVDREEPGLKTPEASFERFWVLEWRPPGRDPRIVGCVGAGTHDLDGVPATELKKLYVHPLLRGRGLATKLCGLVLARARELGHRHVDLWSDTRFDTAHRVYEHLGWVRTGAVRELHDLSDTREFHFVLPLD